jgi:hypothetical protein
VCVTSRRRAALQSAAGAPGALPGWAAPRAVLREPRPPRRLCGLASHRLEVRAVVPFAPAKLGTREHLRTAPYGRRVPPSGPSPDPCCARLPRPAPCWGIKAVRPVAAPAYKGRAPASSRTAAAHRRFCPCVRSRGPPPLAQFAAVQYFLAVPHGLYDLPAPPVPLPDRETAGARRAAARFPGRRRPASYRRFPTHMRPQIDGW